MPVKVCLYLSISREREAPILYYGYVLILYYNRIRFKKQLFPYFFMDHLQYGWGYVFEMLLMLAGVFLVYGYLVILIDRLPGIISGRKEKVGKE